MQNRPSFKKFCGAKTRTGAPCKNMRLYPNGRCKNHGGLSTGCKTEEGKRKSLAALQAGHKKWRLLRAGDARARAHHGVDEGAIVAEF